MTPAPIVRRVDHVSVLVSDPRPLFSTLTALLGLPAGWPVGRFIGFEGAGVALGTAPLELIRFAPGRRSRVPLDRGALAIALEPAGTGPAVAELDRRGIPHAPPVPYAGAAERTPASTHAGWSPGRGPLWTVTIIGGLFGDHELARRFSRPGSRSRATAAITRAISNASARIGLNDALLAATLPTRSWAFLCEYHRLDLEAGRAFNRDLFADGGVGPLGITGLREIVIETSDREGELRRWRDLLAPHEPDSDGRWQLGDGPALRIARAEQHDGQALVVGVESLERAVGFLREHDLLGAHRDGEATVEPARLSGLDLRLTEAQPVPAKGARAAAGTQRREM